MTDNGRTYRERRSRLLPATVWTSRFRGGESVILPDGCMDVIWNGEGFLVAGPDTAPNVYRASGPHRLTAVRFDPGLAPSLLGVRADELRDGRPYLDDLWPRARVRGWREALLRSTDPAVVLEALVAEGLDDHGKAPEWIGPSVSLLRSGASVERTAQAIGMSARQFQRRSVERFGYGAKLLQRILRVRDATEAIRSGRELNDAANDHGFADYAHLQRESRALLGRSPVSFRPIRPSQPSLDDKAA